VDRVEGLRDGLMYAQKVPVPLAAFVAVLGIAIILPYDFGPDSALQGSGNEMTATAPAVSRAGAIEVSSAPRGGRSAPFCASNSVWPGDERLLGSVLNPCNAPLRS
jgi:hypothetical protein